MNQSPLDSAILELVARPKYQPVKPRIIAKKLQVGKDEVAAVKKAIKRLVRGGQLAWGANHMVLATEAGKPDARKPKSSQEKPSKTKSAKSAPSKPPRRKTDPNRVLGLFRRQKEGYGFVRPSGASTSETEVMDIYIPSRKTGDAATGDLVAVHLGDKLTGRHPGPRGEIVEVLERQSHEFVGSYFESDGSAYVQVDAGLFPHAIWVGDPGASGAGRDDKVVFEMVRFPSAAREGEGVITEVLGPRGKPGVDTLLIKREFGLPGEFAEDALEEARQWADRFDGEIPKGRVDLTDETVLTIDPVDARDFDDAISLERLDNGHWRLGVHIADVSHFVQPKTALDREAYDRATSVYLPDQVIPMLPEIISNSLASLQPGKVRYAKTAFIEFTADGARVATDVHTSAIKSQRRLTYEQVDEFLEDRAPWRRKLGLKVHDLLARMHELAMILRGRRFQRGALELSIPEVKIELDRSGKVSGAKLTENTESHQIIEEFMLAANEAVADLLHAKEIPFLRRVHRAPAERKLKALKEFVAELGIDAAGLESRFELQKLLRAVEGQPEQQAVNYALLRSMQRAEYSPAEEGHFALASECYCHFTSPIRRYPDLTIHRLIEAIVTGKPPKANLDRLTTAGEHCSDRERRAESAERELCKMKLLAYLSEKIGEELEVVVTGVESFGLFVRGIELPAEGLVHVSSLDDDNYHFDRTTHTLTGHREGNTFRLGDRLRARVARVDMDRRELDFRLTKTGRRPTHAKKAPAKRKSRPTRPKKKAGKKRGAKGRRR